MGNKTSGIGASVLDKKGYTLLPPNEQKKFEQFQKKRKQSKEEIEETELTSPIPSEPEPSSDKLANDRVKLYKEKNAFNDEKVLQNTEDAEDQ